MELHNVWIAIYISLLLFSESSVSASGHDADLTYTRDQLLTPQTQARSFKHHIPLDCIEILKHKGQRKTSRIRRCVRQIEKTRLQISFPHNHNVECTLSQYQN